MPYHEFSKLSSGAYVSDKTPQTIKRALFTVWFSKFGVPKRKILDLGGEFTNETWYEMLDLLNIKDKTAAAYSPFSNGTVE